MTSPLRVAVVGSGPAGFYAAGQLLGADLAVEVDVLDRLPTPWGLVRHGVAPDHPGIKAVSRVFERIAARPGFRFLGNVEVGRDIGHDELLASYDAVVYAVGAQSDRRLGIEGEDLPGSQSATAFVAWYNGHPDHRAHHVDLSAERAVVIGNGNVALDVARMLALSPEELASTDAADHAVAALARSGVREIVVLGRRGPLQAAFTTSELQELGALGRADVLVDPAELATDDRVEAGTDRSAIAQRNLEVLRDLAARPPAQRPVSLRLRFCVVPRRIVGSERVEAIELERTRLEVGPDGRVRAVPTGVRELLPCGLVLRSVGYRGVAIAGLPFDADLGTVRNAEGRVLAADGGAMPGVYCCGWIKRGPSGVIGTNKRCATETVAGLLHDVEAGRLVGRGHRAADVDAVLEARGIRAVPYAGWERIDTAERAAGAAAGRPRVKICAWDDLLATAAALP